MLVVRYSGREVHGYIYTPRRHDFPPSSRPESGVRCTRPVCARKAQQPRSHPVIPVNADNYSQIRSVNADITATVSPISPQFGLPGAEVNVGRRPRWVVVGECRSTTTSPRLVGCLSNDTRKQWLTIGNTCRDFCGTKNCTPLMGGDEVIKIP